MPTRVLTLIALLFLSAGCSLRSPFGGAPAKPAPLIMTPELRAALKLAYGYELPEAGPPGGWPDYPARELDAALRNVGAKIAADGKMRDRQGKEVYLWCDGPGGGAYLYRDWEKERYDRQRAMDEIRRDCTLIEVPYCGPQPP